MSDNSQRSEKLASALYLITSFFGDQEPLKWKLRTLASDIVSLSIFVRDNSFKEGKAATLDIRNIVLEIRSLILVAKNAGLISDANYSLLDQELGRYFDSLILPSGISEKEGYPILSSKFFNQEKSEVDTNSLGDNYGNLLLKDKNNSVPDEVKKTNLLDEDKSYIKGRDIGSQSIHNGHYIHKEKELKNFGAVSVKKNSRQSVIIGILKRKKEIMIKDVSPLINGCSEKTIQRELSAMVSAGILKKVGEKRWSRYSLA